MSVLDPKIDSVDPGARLIYLGTGVRSIHPIDDIYHEIRHRRVTDEALQQFFPPVTGGGAVPKGGGKFTPRYAIFGHGWRMVPEDVSHTLNVTGEQITDDGQSGPACFDFTVLSAGTSVIVNYEPPAAEIVQLTNTLIEYSSFNGGVTVDVTSPYAGTAFPRGTPQQPVNNMADAHTIAASRGFTQFYVVGDLTIGGGADHEGHTFIGESPTRTTITVLEAADVLGVEFNDATVTGVLDGNSRAVGCLVRDLNYISGFIERCVLSGTISLGGTSDAVFLDCWTGVPGSVEVTIDLGGANGPKTIIRNLNGHAKITNRSNDQPVSVDMASGVLEIDSTVSAGTVTVRGVGTLLDNSSGATVMVSELLSSAELALVRRLLQNRTETNPDTGVMTVYADDNATPLLTADLYEDVAATIPYSGDSQRIDRRDRLE